MRDLSFDAVSRETVSDSTRANIFGPKVIIQNVFAQKYYFPFINRYFFLDYV